jgi:hypothetical protein
MANTGLGNNKSPKNLFSASNNKSKNLFSAPTNNKFGNKANSPVLTSFTSVPNTANLSKSMTDTVNKVNSSLSDLYSPVKESVSEAMNNNSIITIPVIVGLGVLTVLLIIVALFRDQIAYFFQQVYNQLQTLFQPDGSNPNGPNPNGPKDRQHRHHDKIDNAAIQYNVPGIKEVFNIADNKYKYSDAEPLCKAYGAELATYDQVKDAWNKGADWCNYGWVKGQAAVFPTQESTYTKLQAGPDDQKGACGITGVNGGYFDNPELRFGVNCYGNKPGKSDADERAQQKKHAMTNTALEYDRKVQNYKTEIHEIPISPFNTNQWA